MALVNLAKKLESSPVATVGAGPISCLIRWIIPSSKETWPSQSQRMAGVRPMAEAGAVRSTWECAKCD